MSPSEPIDIRFVLSEREFASGVRRMTFRSRVVLTGSVAIFLLLLLGVLLRSWIPLASAVGVLLIFAWAFLFAPRKQWRRQRRRSDEQRYTFSDAGVDITTPVAGAASGWDAYAEIVETSDVYVLRAHDRVCNFVPRRSFSPEQDAAFRALVGRVRAMGVLTSNIEGSGQPSA